MNITVERLPNCIASVRVDVPEETRASRHETVLAKYARSVALPGFRRGKVPRSVVEKRFHEEITREVTDELVNAAVQEAVRKENLKVITVSKFEPDQAEAGQGVRFRVELVLAPEFELPDYKGLKITVPERVVTPENIDRWLQERREMLATFRDVTDRPAAMGDFVKLDYSAAIDGTPMKELLPEAELYLAENEGFLLKLAEDNFVPGFCGQLVGVQPGESREVTVTLPEEGVDAGVAGKSAVYQVTVHGIQGAELPPLDDSFANRIAPGKSLEEVRSMVGDALKSMAERQSLQEKRIAAMEALRDRVEFDLPEPLVAGTAQRRVNELVQMNLDRGVDQETLEENEQEILQAASNQARLDVKDEFLLLEVAKRENLKVAREDIVERIGRISQQTGQPPRKVLKTLQKDNGMDNLRRSIILAKALDVLVDNAEVEYSGTGGAGGDAPAEDAG